ncbi:MAG: ATP-dependent protease subunit HslV [Planctomycetota bacterium]|nr:ATP-dependent protease subunit HslV [Planctomycetota bacterium]
MTTILAIHRDGRAVMAGDGQVSIGHQVQKHGAVKVRALSDGQVLAGFAGGAADAMALMERFDAKLQEHAGMLRRAAVELAKEWRTDRALRRLEAVMIVADATELLLVSGTGDVIAPDDGVLGTGSGGVVAAAAAKALLAHTTLDTEAVCRAALGIAAEIDIYTNERVTLIQTPARMA